MRTLEKLPSQTIELDGEQLTVEQVVEIARAAPDALPTVRLSLPARRNLRDVRNYIDQHWLALDAPPIYGFNTGVGRLKDTHIAPVDMERFQTLVVNAHCAGVGEALPEEVVRATIILRVNALAKGCSGVRVECCDRLLDLLNEGVHPVIPSQGSVGASGDLAPLAHLVSVMIGHDRAEAVYRGKRMPARAALELAGLSPDFKLAPKDVLALINGSTVTLGLAVLALHDAWLLARNADVAAALSMEAMRGELAAFDPRIHVARNQVGQIAVAENVRRLLVSSERTTEDARGVRLADEQRSNGYAPRVQDAYALRCTPQVHGAARDVLQFSETLISRELNAATDNPLIFPDDEAGGYVVLSGGNFHGEPLAYAADLITMAVAELGSISERRCFRLLDPTLSYGLPLNLVGATVGLNTGFSLVHCSAAAIVSENKVLSYPSVVDSIPTKANQEDHVSMSTFAARKARTVVGNAQKVIGIEYQCAAQAIDLSSGPLSGRRLGAGSGAAYTRFRQDVPPTLDDHYQAADMALAAELTRTGELVDAAEQAIGRLS
jgi:histidine ammonia-lyase